VKGEGRGEGERIEKLTCVYIQGKPTEWGHLTNVGQVLAFSGLEIGFSEVF